VKHSAKAREGKIIVVSIATLSIIANVVIIIILFANPLRIFQAVIRIAFAIALVRGVMWMRYFYAVGMALAALVAIHGLYSVTNDTSDFLILFYMISLAYYIAAGVLLIFSKGVSEYFYEKANGIREDAIPPPGRFW